MNTSLTRILLATDGSEDAALAGRAAADISGKTEAELHVVHVWTDAPPPLYPNPLLDDYSGLADQEAREHLRKQAWNARVAGAEVVEEHLREGEPAEKINALAEELNADLVIVGSRGAGRVKRLITGSVSEGVVHGASCPVLVVRGGEDAWPPVRIVVGDDGSGPAKRAGELAAEVAGLFGAEVILVRAYENPPEPVGGWNARDRHELDEALRREREALNERAGQLGALLRDRPGTKLIGTGAALAVSLVAQKREQTLLAVGTRGLNAPKRGLLGSVSTKTLRATDGPVLIAPSETASVRRSLDDARR